MITDQAQALRDPERVAGPGLFRESEGEGSGIDPFVVPRSSPGQRAPAVIAVASGKGGVGKTTIAVNLALLLARQGVRIVLLDGDWGLANADVALGLAPTTHLGHVLAGERSLREALYPGPDGVLLLANASGDARLANAPAPARVLEMLGDLWGAVDLVLADTAPGIGQGTLEIVARAHRTLLVTTPDPTALTDAYGLLKSLRRQGGDRMPCLVVNQAESYWQAQEIERRLALVTRRYLGLACPLAGWIPSDPAAAAALRRQRALVQQTTRAPAAKALQELADRLATWLREVGGAHRSAGRGGQ
ncbi:MAG: P-loop NTPase [Armatimonadetes bacterium]|nr:P-loop NTPase [Armatimonadota bacterium]